MSGEQPIIKASAVRLDSIAAMKIIKLANENPDSNQYGYLLGIVEGDKIEVTNSFPIVETDEDIDQYDYLEYAKKHNLDYHKVGLYVISDQHKQFTLEQFEEANRFQFYVKYSFVLVYQLQLAKSGHPNPFQAFVVNEKYSEIYSKEEISSLNLRNDKLFKTLPIELLKTPLTQAFLFQYRNQIESTFKNNETQLTSNLQNYGKQLIETIEEQVNQSEKINLQGVTKKDQEKQHEVLEYLISMNKLNHLADIIKKEAQFTIETEQTLANILS